MKPRNPNRFTTEGDHAICWLHTRNGETPCLIDIADVPTLAPFTWILARRRKTLYAIHQTNRNGVREQVSMHRVLLGLDDSDARQVDHINRDGLDNRRANLRIVDASLNSYNRDYKPSSGLRGAFYDNNPRRSKPWKAQCSHNKKKLNLGRYATAEEAHAVVMKYLQDNKLIPT